MNKIFLLSTVVILLSSCGMQNTASLRNQTLDISNHSGSFVGGKVNAFTGEYNNIVRLVDENKEKLVKINEQIDLADNEYNSLIQFIEDKLEATTTASNPILVGKLSKAQENLSSLQSGTSDLAKIATDVIAEKEKLYALEAMVNATFAIPGAYDEDHVDLRKIVSAIDVEKENIANLIAKIQTDILNEQDRAERFRQQITNLNIDVAAGYMQSPNSASSKIEVKSLEPITVNRTLAKNKSVRTTTSTVKLDNDKAVIEDLKVENKPENSLKNQEISKKKDSKVNVLLSVEYKDDNIDYYSDLVDAIITNLNENPDVKIEVIATMPMDSKEQDKAQNYMATMFGELLNIGVPAENLSITSKTDITKKFTVIDVIKK